MCADPCCPQAAPGGWRRGAVTARTRRRGPAAGGGQRRGATAGNARGEVRRAPWLERMPVVGSPRGRRDNATLSCVHALQCMRALHTRFGDW